MSDKFHYPPSTKRRRMAIIDAVAEPIVLKSTAAAPPEKFLGKLDEPVVKTEPPPAPELPQGVTREPIAKPPAVRKVPATLAEALKPTPRAPPSPPPTPPTAPKSAQERASMTNEETLNALATKAKATSDAFVLKVQRKRAMGGPIESVATFEGANVNHFANPELWLPKLAGGGPTFLLTGYHVDDPTMPIGGSLQVNVPVSDAFPARSSYDIDVGLPKAASWKGPLSMIWPTEDSKPKQQNIPTIPSLSSPFVSFAANQVPSGAAGMGSEAERARYEMERQKLQEAKEQFEAERRKLELEAIRREHEMRLREIEAKMLQSTPQRSLGDTLAAVMAAAAPFISKVLEGQNEMRMLMFKAQEAQAANQNAMMQFYLNRPAIDPTLEKTIDRLQMFLEKSRENPAGNQMVQQMVDVMSTMTQTTMDMVSQAADLQLGGRQPGESPMIKAVREAVKAMGSMLTGYQVAAQAGGAPGTARPQPQQQQLPFQATPSTAQAYADAARAQPLPQQASGPANGHANQPGSQASFAQAAEPNGQYRGSVLTALENAIKARQPVANVAGLFLRSLQTDEMNQALAECDNQINELIARRLGSWIEAEEANRNYFGQLMEEVSKQGAKMGIFEDEEDDEGDDYEQEDA